MAYPEYFPAVYVWSGVWQEMGYGAIIYIAALSGVSYELHEAAIVDGANIVKRIWHVDIPSILPTFCILLIMRCGSLVSVGFEKAFLMQNSLNISASEIISTYVYKKGLRGTGKDQSYGTAVNLLENVVNCGMLLITNWISKKVSRDEVSLF
jgi:putative aldouronate transport system permease protein